MSLNTNFFRFEQFTIKQSCSAMKVGTDAVILGAWTCLENRPNKILDIGAGTGILSLMMAQRSDASVIDAIELNSDAYQECVENFENSLWNDRLFCYNGSFQDLVMELEDEKYDLIISNPPFFSEKIIINDQSRAQARQTTTLSFHELLVGVKSVLNFMGVFAVIIPYTSEKEFCFLAQSIGLYPKKITHVRGNYNAPIKRSMLLLTHDNLTSITVDELVLEIERNQYTDDYKRLVQDFYIFDRFKL